jgi:hypothetical protein
MNEPQAPAGPRWDAPGWAEADLSDSAEVSALKAALESAAGRAEEWREAHDGLILERAEHLKEISRLQKLNFEHRFYADQRQWRFISVGFAFGFLGALAIYGVLAWIGYV